MLEHLLQRTLPIEALPGIHHFNSVSVLRLDKISPLISGNKAFKLQGHLTAAQDAGRARLLSFGGPFSNHLHALAALGSQLGIATIGVVRGYEHLPLTPTLEDCHRWGMTLLFADKKTYAQRYDSDYQKRLAATHDAYVIPEGGAGLAAQAGCALLAPYCEGFAQVWLSVGTGTTLLGLANALVQQSYHCPELIGVNVVADQGERQRFLQQQMPNVRWRLLEDYHAGGFGRCPDHIQALIERYDALGLPLDPVYTAKLVHAFECEVSRDEAFSAGKILLIHTGGLQGRRGYQLSWPEALHGSVFQRPVIGHD